MTQTATITITEDKSAGGNITSKLVFDPPITTREQWCIAAELAKQAMERIKQCTDVMQAEGVTVMDKMIEQSIGPTCKPPKRP